MGILDDAIREHLDLKRKHGAADDEVQILEDEAFGPPSRPGEPDFPERPPTGEQALVEESPTGSEDLSGADDAPAGRPPEPAAAEPAAPPEATPAEPGAPYADEPEPPAPAEPTPSGFFDQEEAAGPPTIEHPPPPPPEDEVELAPALDPEPPATGEADDFEVGEIELELDEEFEEFRDTDDEPAAAVPEAPAEPHVVEPPSEEFELGSEVEEVEEVAEEPAPAGDADDVLEETPEFLRDTPEDERLWFEQGEPQDFDFDEDEDEDDGR